MGIARNSRFVAGVRPRAPARQRSHALVSRCQNRAMSSPHPLITTDPRRRGGRPCIRHLRITVGDVLGWLAQGMSVDDILADYPELTAADVQACLSYAAERESHEVRIATAA